MPTISTHASAPCEYCGLSRLFLSLLDSPLCNTSLAFTPADITAANATTASLRDGIHGLEEAIEHLKRRKARAEARLAEQLSLVAPIHRLSDDALLMIMETACQMHDLAHSYQDIPFNEPSQPTETQSPRWSIAAVSRRWRTLALSAPQLWTRLDFGRFYPRTNLEPLRTSLQIERSKNKPLVVRVDISEKQFYGLVRNGALKLQLHRIQTLDLDYCGFNEPKLWPRPLSLVSLQRLRVSGCVLSDQDTFLDTPSLNHLVLYYCALTPNILTTDSWSALTYLQLENCDEPRRRDLLQVLRSTCNLCMLKIVPGSQGEDDGDWAPFGGEDIVTLLHLKSFHISFQFTNRVSRALLRIIRTPNLAHLEMAHPDEADVQRIPSLISTSADEANHSLTTLTLLYPPPFSPEHDSPHRLQVYSLLQQLASLQRLKILTASPDFLDLLFLALASLTGPDAYPFPHLQELHIQDRSSSPVLSPRSLRAFCDGRQALASTSNITFATVFLSEGILRAVDGTEEDDGDTMQWVDEARESGLLQYPAPKDSWVDIF